MTETKAERHVGELISELCEMQGIGPDAGRGRRMLNRLLAVLAVANPAIGSIRFEFKDGRPSEIEMHDQRGGLLYSELLKPNGGRVSVWMEELEC